MALRLIDAPASPQAAPARLPLADRLHPRASALLAAHDLEGWRGLFAEAAAEPDVHRRFQARSVLLDTALACTAGTPRQTAERFTALAAAAIALLEEDPREPTVLNRAGVAFYELGALEPAQALFSAALRLDPQLEHAQGNLAEVRRRRHLGLTSLKGLPPQVAQTVKRLSPRAKDVARKAQPATGMTLSLCMIVKDEEAMLGQCLAAAKAAVDEIVVVDTGSTDRTVEIAREHGATVLHREWTGDFAAARNASFDAAASDWIVYLDADEVLVEQDAEQLRALTGRTWREAFWLVETNHTGALEDGTSTTHNALRMFRNRAEYRFEGRIHEQIAHRLPTPFLPERAEVSDVRVEHFGYLGVVREAKAKSSRNLELLERQRNEGVDTPFLYFNLGSEHAALGHAEDALTAFRRAWELLAGNPNRNRLGYVPSLAGRLVKALRICGELDEGDARAQEVLDLFPAYTDIVLEQGHLAKLRGDLDTAIERWRTCLLLGDAPAAYSATVGSGTFLARAALSDAHVAQGDLAEAERVLRESLAAHPSYLGTVERLAVVLLKNGTAPQDVVALVHDGVTSLTPGARFLLGVALFEAGATAEAEDELRAVVVAQPGADAARIALSEAVLAQGRLPEAAAVAAGTTPGSPLHGAGLRTRLFVALTEDDHDIARALLEEADGVLGPDELGVFRCWAGTSAGASPGAAPVVLRMLDALIRLERFEAFETLAGVFGRLGLPQREQHEQLAQLYLRRGFLESAADEWIAVVQDLGPDPAAFAGLAEVAAQRGFLDDARMFAEEAQALAATSDYRG